MTHFIPTTQLQRNTKKVLNSEVPFQVILSNSEVAGIVINKKTAKMLLESDALTQMREELWEANDPTTVEMIKNARAGKHEDSISLSDYRAKHGLWNNDLQPKTMV